MDRRLSLIAAVIMAAALTLGMQLSVLAAPPPQTSAAEAKAAFHRVMAATDRSQISDQDLALAVAWVTPVSSSTTSTKSEQSGAIMMGGGCATNSIATYHNNGWGQRLWTYILSQSFCTDGSLITYAGTPIAGPSGTLYACWAFGGNISGPTSTYGVGYNVVVADAQGKFTCSFPLVGQVAEDDPALHLVTWGDSFP